MRKGRLEEDANIVKKLKDRFDRYGMAVKTEKKKLEEKLNERVSIENFCTCTVKSLTEFW